MGRQAVVCAVSDAHADYALKVKARLQRLGYHVEVDISRNTLNKYDTVPGLRWAWAPGLGSGPG